VAYFWEFWHLDAMGTKALSAIGGLTYDPAEMPYPRAEAFFKAQRAKLVEQRKSKYGQKPEVTRLPLGSLAVFFQGDFPLKQGVTRFDDLTMLQVVRDQAGQRPIVVKPHPLVSDPLTIAELRGLARRDRRLVVTDANVHDILTTCVASVSINSTVALEGFLHRKPAVLFGQADFHHFAGRVTSEADFAPVLRQELQRKGGYAQYLAWYFLRHCLRHGAADTDANIWARFAAAGFARERLTSGG
jgi:Capsule polysaccharide biosynthesis protein